MDICYNISSYLYKKKKLKKSQEIHGFNDYIKWQFDSSQQLLSLYPDLDVTDKSVLEIGCGTGGRTMYMASKGAKKVVGIDINHDEIDIANDYKKTLPEHISSKLSFIKTSDNADELNNEKFDIVLLIDSLEHVKDPIEILNLAYSMTKSGGAAYFGTFGWYHHKGSHMNSILSIPFVNLWFSDKTILDATRKLISQPFYEPTRFDTDPPLLRWEGVDDLKDRPGEYLNKITIKGMRKAINNSKFDNGKLHVIGFSQKRPILRALNFLSKIPIIQEVYHSYCVGKLSKK